MESGRPRSTARFRCVSLRLACVEGPSDKAAAVPLPFHQSRKSALHPHFAWIAEEDRGNDGVHQIVQNFRTKFSLHKPSQTLFPVWRARKAKRLTENSQLGFEPQQLGLNQAARRERDKMEAATAEYVSLGFGISSHKFTFEIQVADQLPYGCRKAGQLRPSLE